MLYVRGNKRDYDSWRALGNVGWDYESVLPYFKKSEDIRVKELLDSPYHQKGGYLKVEHFKYKPILIDYIIRSGEELNYKLLDINGENQTGFTHSYGTLKDGLRYDTAKAFLRPAARRENLHISLQSLVEKIIIKEGLQNFNCYFDSAKINRQFIIQNYSYCNIYCFESTDGISKIANGVLFRRRTKHFTVRAKREIILSAGAIQSPQLLMLSGIGPKDHLKEMKIPLVHHMPGVGRNLQDHVAIGGVTYIIDPPPNLENIYEHSPTVSGLVTLENFQKFVQNKTGTFYMTLMGIGMAFIKTK